MGDSTPYRPVTLRQILRWADSHRRRTGRWPTKTNGPVLDAPDETWTAIDSVLWGGGVGQ